MTSVEGLKQQPSRPRRRHRPRPAPGEALIVERPQILEVLDVQAGTFVSAGEVMGNDYARLMRLRMEVRTQMRRGTPLYKCAICGVAVHICCSRDSSRFFFKHRHEDGNCPAVTAGTLNQTEIDARKYNGVKESRLHLQMKEWLVRCLSADKEFSDIRTEQVWKGAWSPQWRKPDVQAIYHGQRIAFEIQLSTTFLDVIAGRRDFYLAEGGLLFWIFARFDTDRLRMTDDDVFYNNNANAFVVNAQTLDQSLRDGAFQLECIWSVPLSNGQTSGLHRKWVRFDELTLDAPTQRGFFFDFDAARRALQQKEQAIGEELRDKFEQLFGSREIYGDEGRANWADLKSRFARLGVPFVYYPRDLPFELLQGLYSAKHGHPFASKRKLLVEAAHQVANGGRHLRWFSQALRHYERGAQLKAEDRSGNWARKVKACRELERRSPDAFEPDRQHQELIEFLFPELRPLA
jgi:hypothetical protein